MTGIAWGAIVTLSVFVLSHLASTIYWAAKITTILNVVQKDLCELAIEFKAMRSSYVSKEEFAYRIANSDKEHAAMWRRIDEVVGSK